jgi:hypothetical protein
MYLPHFNRITKQLDKAVKGLEEDIEIVEAAIEKQEGIIAQAQAATELLMASKRAVSNLRDQLKAITA